MVIAKILEYPQTSFKVRLFEHKVSKVEAPKGAKIRSFSTLGGRVSMRAFTVFLAN